MKVIGSKLDFTLLMSSNKRFQNFIVKNTENLKISKTNEHRRGNQCTKFVTSCRNIICVVRFALAVGGTVRVGSSCNSSKRERSWRRVLSPRHRQHPLPHSTFLEIVALLNYFWSYYDSRAFSHARTRAHTTTHARLYTCCWFFFCSAFEGKYINVMYGFIIISVRL